MTTATRTVTPVKIQPKLDIMPPPYFNVIYINDNVTTMEFVVESLKTIFDYDEQPAVDICVKIHEQGSAVVATLPYEIAEQKGIEVTLDARSQGFPLQVKVEAEA